MNIHIIISAHVASETPAFNVSHTCMLRDELTKEGREFAEVEGVYKGTKEASFFITLKPTRDIDIRNLFDYIAEKVEKYQRECAMLVLHKGDCYLINKDHTQDYIGKFTTVNEQPNSDNYTFNPSTGEYYIADNGMN